MKKLLILIVLGSMAFADRVTVHNKTTRDIYTAIYYVEGKLPWESKYPNAKLASDIVFIEADSSGILQRPRREIGKDRQLVFAEQKEVLKPELAYEQLMVPKPEIRNKNVGDLQGDVFYIGDRKALLTGYTTVEWNVEKPLLEAARAAVFNSVPQIKENPYKNIPAKVRLGNELAEQEKVFLQHRIPKTKIAIERLVGAPVEVVPNISIVCSGGGYRAMLYCLGALIGAQKVGILDATRYVVGLSGSTWAISGWLLSGLSLQAYHDWLISDLNRGLKQVSAADMSLISDHLLAKYLYDQPYALVDIYGSLLANELFKRQGNLKQRQTLSGQANAIKDGILPMPIYTAIAAEGIKSEQNWYEFTPYEVGAQWMGAYVPSWAFGRKFKNGASTNFAPEQNFGVLMGTFGLAIGLTIERLVEELKLKEKSSSEWVQNIINQILKKQGEFRFTTADYRNFVRDITNVPLTNQKVLKMVDAGIGYNLPYPPISGQRPERKADIIIFVDASGDDFPADFKKTEAYARAKNLPFPKIDFSKVTKKAVSVFNDNKPGVPIVIYVPRVVDPALFADREYAALATDFNTIKAFDVDSCILYGPCSTFNFNYSSTDAKKLTYLGMLNMMAAKKPVADAIRSLQPKKG